MDVVDLSRRALMSVVEKSDASLRAWANRQSPKSTETWLPQRAESVGWLRRIVAASMMSSCTSVARWIISITTAIFTSSSHAGPIVPPASATNVGRSCLPWFASA